MEKFAVDLDKVLDDFELNEDRAERFAAKSRPPVPVPKVPQPPQPLLGRLLDNSKRDAHPEGSERPLRRINLLDADFAPDPPAPINVFLSGNDRSSSAIGHLPPATVLIPSKPPSLANGESVPEGNEGPTSAVNCVGVVVSPQVGGCVLADEGSSPPSPAAVSSPSLLPASPIDASEGESEDMHGVGSPKTNVDDGCILDPTESDVVDRRNALMTPSTPTECGADVGLVRSCSDYTSSGSVVGGVLLQPDVDRPLGVGFVDVKCVPCLDAVDVGEGGVTPSSLERHPLPVDEEQPVGGGEEEEAEGRGGVSGDDSEESSSEEVKPISFQAEEELSDAEFAKYLAELEEEEGGSVGVVVGGEEVAKEAGDDGGEGVASPRSRAVVEEGLKVVEDCRVEAWAEEGSGRALLDGASSPPLVDSSLPPPSPREGDGGATGGATTVAVVAPPQRPDTLDLLVVQPHPTMLALDGDDEDEDTSIPIPLVIGPPGATPANPRPPSEIAAVDVEVLRAEKRTSQGSLDSCEVGTLGETVVAKEEEGVVDSTISLSVEGAGPILVAPSTEETKVEGQSSAPSSSSSSSDADEGALPNDVVGSVDGQEDGNGASIPKVASGQVDPDNVGLVAEGSLSSSPMVQVVSDVVVGEELRLSHGSSSAALSLGDVAPFWVPDADAPACMLCMAKFTLIKRRHHCRACGKVLCSKCCSSKARLAYMDHSEARVCAPCQSIIVQEASAATPTSGGHYPPNSGRQGDCLLDQGLASDHSPPRRSAAGRPDPNNPMEYCSTVPPLEQVGERARAPPPSVMVPVGVLKREGSSSRSKGETAKQVMFSDGIRPGGELSDLDRSPNVVSASSKSPSGLSAVQRKIASRLAKRLPGTGPPGSSPTPLLPAVGSSSIPGDALPPVIVDPSTAKGSVAIGVGGGGIAGAYNFEEGPELERLVETLMDESEPPVAFALSKNFFVLVKIITLDCCVNRVVWSFTTRGMRCVGQDEVVVLLEWLPSDKGPPRDIFCHLSALYEQASKGNTVTELGHSTVQGAFLGSHNHGGFLYVRATFQCLRRLPLPPPPYLFGLLLHRMETPWAKVFPIRVMLRLGAEFRYYPCPLVGIRGREPVYHQIGHTIMNLLSDFRNFTYVLPSVRGMVIHMEERQTSILLPKNRLSQVERALDDSDDHVLALAASFSSAADSHLVCVQGEAGDASSSHYHTQAINIQNKPRKVTGASFVVFNGALKVSAKLTAKSSIVEDGLMVQVLPDTLVTLRNALRNGEDYVIPCGPISPASPPPPPAHVPPEVAEGEECDSGAGTISEEVTVTPPSAPPSVEATVCTAPQPNALPDEVVVIRWVEDDKNFNIGVKSPIDGMALDGVPSIRVHNGTNYVSDTKFIRWTEVFLIQQQSGETPPSGRGETMDVSRISESIAHAVCLALHPYLDLLWSHALTLIAVRATLGPDSEGYEAGCGGSRLPPIYMNSLDNELIGVLHRIEWRPPETNNQPLILELLFHLMEL